MYLLCVVEELPLSFFGVPFMPDPDGNGDWESKRVLGLQIRWPYEKLAVVLIEMAVIETDAGLEPHYLLWVAKGEL